MQSLIDFNIPYKVACHTANVGLGSTFVAIKGKQRNGVDYINEAISLGATTIVIEDDTILNQNVIDLIKSNHVKLIKVKNSRQALSNLAAKAYGYPAKSLKIIGVTGTKGKTTTSFLIERLLASAGYKTALISTVKNKILNIDCKSTMTTEQPDYLHFFLANCVKAEVEYVVMEVAAQALSMHRVDDILFDAAIFTNFSLEHSEFYENINAYFKAKLEIINKIKKNGFLLINDDNSFLNKLKTKKILLHRYGICSSNKLISSANILKNDFNGVSVEINCNNNKLTLNSKNLFGKFNVYNILAASTMAKLLGIDNNTIENTINNFDLVPGRMQRQVLPNGAIGIIDYASNPESFESVLSTLRLVTKNLIVVFGAGGDRDKSKRPFMGEIASRYANKIILTTDNPRSENPKDIVQDIIKGISDCNLQKIIVELDRELAIKKAYKLSTKESILALLGKGPDEYQIVNGNKTYFSEASILATL